jgi:hypothetical protein
MTAPSPDPPPFDELGDVVLLEYEPPHPRGQRVTMSLAAACIVVAAAAGIWLTSADDTATTPPATHAPGQCFADPGTFTARSGATFGPPTPPGFTGEVTQAMIDAAPEFVTFACGDGTDRIRGWTKKEETRQLSAQYYNVYDDDGTTVVGRYYVRDANICGFVATGEDPAKSVCEPTVTESGPPPHNPASVAPTDATSAR